LRDKNQQDYYLQKNFLRHINLLLDHLKIFTKFLSKEQTELYQNLEIVLINLEYLSSITSQQKKFNKVASQRERKVALQELQELFQK
jgi:hypothetical protein